MYYTVTINELSNHINYNNNKNTTTTKTQLQQKHNNNNKTQLQQYHNYVYVCFLIKRCILSSKVEVLFSSQTFKCRKEFPHKQLKRV